MSVGTRIKERRLQLGYKQSELAEMLKITPSAIGNYETGVSHPKEDVLYGLFKFLKCDANYLFQDEFNSLTKTLSPEQKQLIEYYNNSNDSGKKLIMTTAEYTASCNEKNKINIKEKF